MAIELQDKALPATLTQEALIIADNRDNEQLNFSQKNKKDVTDIVRINEELKSIKSIRGDFTEFRETVNQYNAKTQTVAEYLYAFNNLYNPTLGEMEKKILKEN